MLLHQVFGVQNVEKLGRYFNGIWSIITNKSIILFRKKLMQKNYVSFAN